MGSVRHSAQLSLTMRITMLLVVFIFLIATTIAAKHCPRKCKKLCGREGKICQVKNPKKPVKRNCLNTRCVPKPCACPMIDAPVCDQHGNQYANMDCAICEGMKEHQLKPCPIGIMGFTGAPGGNIIF